MWLGPKQPGMDQAFEAARRMQVLKDMPEGVLGEGMVSQDILLGTELMSIRAARTLFLAWNDRRGIRHSCFLSV